MTDGCRRRRGCHRGRRRHHSARNHTSANRTFHILVRKLSFEFGFQRNQGPNQLFTRFIEKRLGCDGTIRLDLDKKVGMERGT